MLFVDKGSYAEKYSAKLKGKYRVAYAYNGTKLFTYTVKKGDTVSKLAKKYLGSASRYKEILHVNKMTSTKLKTGQKIIIAK